MEKMLSTILIVAGIVVAAIIISAGFGNIPGTNISPTGEVQRNTISVIGEANLDIEPDKAEILLQVETRALTAKEAEDENSRITDNVITALKKSGVGSDEIETDRFSIYPEYDWDEGYRELVGYRAEHTLKVTTTDTGKVGVYLDVAVDNGVNEVQGVNFGLTREKEKEVYSEALVRASSLAEEKASSIAASLGVRLGDIISVSESSAGYSPYRYFDYAVSEMSMKGAGPAPIQPEKVTVNGHVSLVFEIE